MQVGAAFGLAISADRAIPFLGSGEGPPGERKLRIELSQPAEPSWPGGELICDERRSDGSVEFQIEAGAASYRIHGPDYGTCLLAADGRALTGRAGRGGMVAWQRLLVAQSLPFAAALQGLEVFHASAVEIDSGAVAFTGPSGSGKTSLALALQRGGAGLLADDVLAVELVEDEAIAHPGAAMTGIDHAEVERLRAEGVELGEVLGTNERELLVRTAPVPTPLRLGALFLLERRSDGPTRPRFDDAADAQALLASTFNLLLSSPERLTRQLEICATIARLRVQRVVFGPAVDAGELAASVRGRLGAPA